jgi:hypothetical protein
MRRAMWLGTGAALGAGATVWTQRRVGRLASRLRPGSIAGEMSARVDRRRRALGGRVRDALDDGRAQARRREDEIWSDIRVSGERG